MMIDDGDDGGDDDEEEDVHNDQEYKCLISNVLLNRSHGWLYTVQYTEYIGCIYMTFLHCVFSDGSLNSLPKKIQSHTDCTHLAFFPLFVQHDDDDADNDG